MEDKLIIKTSGSTGEPKVISLPIQLVRRSAERSNKFFGIDSSSHLYACISPEFIGGRMMKYRADLAGCRLTYEQPSSNPLTKCQPTDRLSLVSVVAAQVKSLLERQSDLLPIIDNLLIGGSAIPPTLRQLIAVSQFNSWESYGMTETASHIAVRPVTLQETPFKPLPGIKVSLDPRGCLVISEPEVNAAEYPLNIVTNDLAEIYPDGSFSIIGRADDMIVTGGKKIHPAILEKIIGEVIATPFLITSIPDEKWGEAITIVATPPHTPESLRMAVQSIPETLLPRWQRPKQYKIIPTLPLTKSGKPLRRFGELKKML